MSILNNWVVYVIGYLCAATVFTQFYKITTKTLTNAGALTILLEGIAGLTGLILSIFFEYKYPSDIKTYVMLGISIVFFTMSDRINTIVRSGLETSTFSMLKQLSTAFMFFAGLIFLKEPFILNKFIGSMLIIFSNVFIFYKKGKFKLNKYIYLAILANIVYSIALFLSVNISDQFNTPLYVSITTLIPALLILLVERIKIKDLKDEFNNGNKKAIITTGITWGISIFLSYRAYQLGNVTIVAPLCALTVMLSVIVGYLFLKEKDNMIKKVISAVLILISIILIRI